MQWLMCVGSMQKVHDVACKILLLACCGEGMETAVMKADMKKKLQVYAFDIFP